MKTKQNKKKLEVLKRKNFKALVDYTLGLANSNIGEEIITSMLLSLIDDLDAINVLQKSLHDDGYVVIDKNGNNKANPILSKYIELEKKANATKVAILKEYREMDNTEVDELLEFIASPSKNKNKNKKGA